MSIRVHYLQNLSVAHIGNIRSWAQSGGHQLSGTHLYDGEMLPSLDEFDVLVVLGGVPEDCKAWLNDEIEFIRQAVEAGKGMVGICLGSQLLACAMGGELVPHTCAESGWLPVKFTQTAQAHPLLKGVADQELFFFHKNIAVLPESFVLHASTEGCKNQVFTYGDRAIGFQFHPEMVDTTIRYLARYDAGNLPDGPYHRVCEEDADETSRLEAAGALIAQVLDNMCDVLV